MRKYRNKQTGEIIICNGDFMDNFIYENMDKRTLEVVNTNESKPLVTIETSLCKLFNSYFGFDLLRHEVPILELTAT